MYNAFYNDSRLVLPISKVAILTELRKLVLKLSKEIEGIFENNKINLIKKKAKNADAEFEVVLYIFSSFDICNTILRCLNRYNFKYISSIISKLYQGFATTEYSMAPRQIIFIQVFIMITVTLMNIKKEEFYIRIS